jgi:hypothetical protein
MLARLTPPLKLMVTSRQHIDLIHHIPAVRLVEVLAHDEDVKSYVQARLLDANSELGRLISGNIKFQRRIIDVVVEKAQGMYVQLPALSGTSAILTADSAILTAFLLQTQPYTVNDNLSLPTKKF